MAYTKLFFENCLRRTIHVRLTPVRGMLTIEYGRRELHGSFSISPASTVYSDIDDRIRSCMHEKVPPDPKRARLSYELVPIGKPGCTVAVVRGRRTEGPVFVFEELPN